MAINYTDAQIRKLFPTYFDAAATATQVDEDIIREILRMYSGKEGGRTYIGDKLKLNQTVVGRIINKAIKKNILKRVKPGEFKTKDTQRIYKDISERKIYKTVRPITANDRKINPDIPANAKFKVQVPSGQKKPTSTKMVYTTTEAAAENAITKADKFTEISKLAKEKPFKDAVKTIHRIAMADPEDLNNIKKLSKMVYGADDVKNLTRTANDLVRYQEFLLGFRPIAGITIPVGEKLDDIISEIPASGQWGKFAAGAIRESKLKIRDQLLKTKGPKLIALRNNILKFVDSGAMELDEAMGVSATYERAPGYTELGQVIKKNINQAKRTEIDNPFSRLFSKVVAGETNPTIIHNGEEIGIKEFNKLSREFQKINKVDTPIIEYKPGQKLDASKFIKHFDKLSPEAQVNVKELAGKGIALRSEALPMRAILLKAAETNEGGVCQIFRAEGGRIGFAAGSNCARQMEMAFDTDPVKTTEQINKIKTVPEKVKSAGMGFLNLVKRGGKFGALAAVGAGAAAIVKPFMNDDVSTYLSDEGQQKNMLKSMILDPITQPDEKITEDEVNVFDKAYLPTLGAVTAAGAIPGGKRLFDVRKRMGAGNIRAALSPIRGVLGKGLAATGTPLGIAALEPLYLASQISEGDSLGEIATNPLNYLAPAFAGGLSREATRFVGPTASKVMRLGISPTALKTFSRRFGLPGLALSSGISGFEMLQNYRAGRGLFDDG